MLISCLLMFTHVYIMRGGRHLISPHADLVLISCLLMSTHVYSCLRHARWAAGACAALLANLSASPSEIFSQLSAEMSAQTPQGAMSPYQLVAQVLIATYAVHLVVDLPNGAGAFGGTVDGPLWGASD